MSASRVSPRSPTNTTFPADRAGHAPEHIGTGAIYTDEFCSHSVQFLSLSRLRHFQPSIDTMSGRQGINRKTGHGRSTHTKKSENKTEGKAALRTAQGKSSVGIVMHAGLMKKDGAASKTKSAKHESDSSTHKSGKTERKTGHGHSNVSMKHGMKKGGAGKGNWGVAGDEAVDSD